MKKNIESIKLILFSVWILWGLFISSSEDKRLSLAYEVKGKSIQKMKLDKFRCFVVLATEHVLYWQNMLSDIGILWKSI